MRLFSSLPNNLKDVTAFDEKHDAVYCSVCATANCNADYIGVCARRLNLIERVKNHIGRDRNSHMVKQTTECGDEPVPKGNFQIIANGFGNNANTKKKSEVLMTKRFKPSLNIKEKSAKLQSFNWSYL